MSKGLDFADIMKQAQQMQERLAEVQDRAASRTAEASSGGGMVTAVVNGRSQLVSLRIDPKVVGGGDIEMMQDLVIAAVNQAVHKAQELVAEEMQSLAGGLKLPTGD